MTSIEKIQDAEQDIYNETVLALKGLISEKVGSEKELIEERKAEIDTLKLALQFIKDQKLTAIPKNNKLLGALNGIPRKKNLPFIKAKTG